MKTLTFGAGLFIIAILAHIAIWRFRLPKNHIKALILIFAITLSAGLLFSKRAEFEIFSAAFLYISLALAYIASYPAIEADSPSISIISMIANAGSKGQSKEDIESAMGDDILILPRLNDLLKSRLISLNEGRYALMPRGRIAVRIFALSRKLLEEGALGG